MDTSILTAFNSLSSREQIKYMLNALWIMAEDGSAFAAKQFDLLVTRLNAEFDAANAVQLAA